MSPGPNLPPHRTFLSSSFSLLCSSALIEVGERLFFMHHQNWWAGRTSSNYLTQTRQRLPVKPPLYFSWWGEKRAEVGGREKGRIMTSKHEYKCAWWRVCRFYTETRFRETSSDTEWLDFIGTFRNEMLKWTNVSMKPRQRAIFPQFQALQTEWDAIVSVFFQRVSLETRLTVFSLNRQSPKMPSVTVCPTVPN